MKTLMLILTLSIIAITKAFAQRSDKAEGVKLTLRSIQIDGDTLFLNLKIKNRSLVNYHWSEMRVFSKDRHIPRRTAIQELDFAPMTPYRSMAVPPDSSLYFPIAYQAFTIPHSKLLIIQASEPSGNRVLTLRIKGRWFMRLLRKK